MRRITPPPQAMLLFVGPSAFEAHLSSTLQSFVEDNVAAVRRCVACGFHEVRKYFIKVS